MTNSWRSVSTEQAAEGGAPRVAAGICRLGTQAVRYALLQFPAVSIFGKALHVFVLVLRQERARSSFGDVATEATGVFVAKYYGRLQPLCRGREIELHAIAADSQNRVPSPAMTLSILSGCAKMVTDWKVTPKQSLFLGSGVSTTFYRHCRVSPLLT
jgi:hypothetical protein